MTPSEIAEECITLSQLESGWYADVGRKTGERCCEAMRNAAATIRAQADALKIATEALERIGETKGGSIERGGSCWSSRSASMAAQALARIKESK